MTTYQRNPLIASNRERLIVEAPQSQKIKIAE